MPRFLCTVYTYSTRLRFGITYTHSFGTHTRMTFPPPASETTLQYLHTVWVPAAVENLILSVPNHWVVHIYTRLFEVQNTKLNLLIVIFQICLAITKVSAFVDILCLFRKESSYF